MAPIGLGLTMSIQSGSSALDAADASGTAPSQVVYHVPPASQAPAAPSDAAQQDTVTLSGKSPASRNQTASQNFVSTAAFTLLAHEFTFPPNIPRTLTRPRLGAPILPRQPPIKRRRRRSRRRQLSRRGPSTRPPWRWQPPPRNLQRAANPRMPQRAMQTAPGLRVQAL